MKHFFVTLITLFSLCYSSFTLAADEQSWLPPIISPITKGSPAPYSGVLLSPEAVAKVIADSKDCPRRIQVESEHARDVQKANDEKVLADVNAQSQKDKKVLQASIDSKSAQIKDLMLSLSKSEAARSNTWIWVAGGVLAGSLLAIGSVVLVGVANK